MRIRSLFEPIVLSVRTAEESVNETEDASEKAVSEVGLSSPCHPPSLFLYLPSFPSFPLFHTCPVLSSAVPSVHGMSYSPSKWKESGCCVLPIPKSPRDARDSSVPTVLSIPKFPIGVHRTTLGVPSHSTAVPSLSPLGIKGRHGTLLEVPSHSSP